MQTEEQKRLDAPYTERIHPWKQWGPYVAERIWGTVREDYSPNGDAWDFLTHDMARSKAYRWGEDGIAGFCDQYQILAFAFAFWNGKDPILKERLFGLNPYESNHGEDVKEYYFYLDATPTYSYAKFLYKYPQRAYPYERLVEESRGRTTKDREYELLDTGIFDDNRYFDIYIEYAKADPSDICIQVEICNRGDAPAPIHLVPHLWFRNRWTWNPQFYANRPSIGVVNQGKSFGLKADSSEMRPTKRLPFLYQLPEMYLYGDSGAELLFTENESNDERLYDIKNQIPYVKDAFHRHIVQGEACTNRAQKGTKACLHYKNLLIEPGKSRMLSFRLTNKELADPLMDVTRIVAERKNEADAYYQTVHAASLTDDEKLVQRQALAGMLWSKQVYMYGVMEWLQGDNESYPPPASRYHIRNYHWTHMYGWDVISMPDTWEYPWFAAWDLAFHCVPLSLVDIEFAKNQLKLLLTDRYQHPNGQIPAYEWGFSDLNPPVQAWSLWKIYQQEVRVKGKGDRWFLEVCFGKLVHNFVWWVNKVDRVGNNCFEGGFLGLDNISIIDRSKPLPDGGRLEQSDGTGWMAQFSLIMMRLALELAKEDDVYQESAIMYFEHFVYIAAAIQGRGELSVAQSINMWNDEDGFFYDVASFPDGRKEMIKVRSFVGIIPFYATDFFDEEELKSFSRFYEHFRIFVEFHPGQAQNTVTKFQVGDKSRYLFSIMDQRQIQKLLTKVWDPEEFLSAYGLRSLSKYHEQNPFEFEGHRVDYEPGESLEKIKGGNSNWRGPIWLPTNFLFLDALIRMSRAFGETLTVTPRGSAQPITLKEMAHTLAQRLIDLFRKNQEEERAVYSDQKWPQHDPHWKELILFYEHFHGDTGRGLGASHQTGWTGLIASVIDELNFLH